MLPTAQALQRMASVLLDLLTQPQAAVRRLLDAAKRSVVDRSVAEVVYDVATLAQRLNATGGDVTGGVLTRLANAVRVGARSTPPRQLPPQCMPTAVSPRRLATLRFASHRASLSSSSPVASQPLEVSLELKCRVRPPPNGARMEALTLALAALVKPGEAAAAIVGAGPVDGDAVAGSGGAPGTESSASLFGWLLPAWRWLSTGNYMGAGIETPVATLHMAAFHIAPTARHAIVPITIRIEPQLLRPYLVALERSVKAAIRSPSEAAAILDTFAATLAEALRGYKVRGGAGRHRRAASTAEIP